VKPVGTVLVKHASPFTPQVPDPYPIGFEEVLSYPNVAACDARVALLSPAASRTAVRIALGGSEPERQRNSRAWL
jgi:hypothetical protein